MFKNEFYLRRKLSFVLIVAGLSIEIGYEQGKERQTHMERQR
jgi:hypothetical protein